MINFRKFLRSRVSITKRSCFDIVLATNYRYVCVDDYFHAQESTGQFRELTKMPRRNKKMVTSFTDTIHKWLSPYNKNKNEARLFTWICLTI